MLGIEARSDALAAGQQDVGTTADLDPSRTPRRCRGEVVHDEGDPGVLLHVPKLLSSGEAVAAYVDRVVFGVVAEGHRHDMRLPVFADGGNATEPLSLQVCDLGISEEAHRF